MPFSSSTKETHGEAALLYVAFGSNQGDRENLILRAARMLGEKIGKLVSMSALYETKPEGFVSESLFLNAAAAYETTKKARSILKISQRIERELGRQEKSKDGIYHDRPIDIDLLWKSDESMETSSLVMPHPRMKERLFVMEPLAEIAPEMQLDGEGIFGIIEKLKKDTK